MKKSTAAVDDRQGVIPIDLPPLRKRTSAPRGERRGNAADLGRFTNLNVEQQAQIAQDHYRAEHLLPAMGAVGFQPMADALRSALGFGG